MGKPVRKIKVDLSSFDSAWTDSFVLISTSGFNDQKDFAIRLSKVDREREKLSRAHKKAQRKLDKLIEAGKDAGDEYDALEKEEDTLYNESEKASLKTYDFMQKEVIPRFISGKIVDGDTGKLRDMVKEDLVEFDLEVFTEIARRVAGQTSKNA